MYIWNMEYVNCFLFVSTYLCERHWIRDTSRDIHKFVYYFMLLSCFMLTSNICTNKETEYISLYYFIHESTTHICRAQFDRMWQCKYNIELSRTIFEKKPCICPIQKKVSKLKHSIICHITTYPRPVCRSVCPSLFHARSSNSVQCSLRLRPFSTETISYG